MTSICCTELSVSWRFCIVGALMIMLLPMNLLLSAVCAAVVHESCHLAALRLFRIPIYRIRIDTAGTVIETAPLSQTQELLCSMAGPAGSLLCVLLLRPFPLFAICGLIQGIYNLLPLFPLDGGRILRSAASLIIPKYADKLCSVIKWITIFFICVFFITLTVCTQIYFLLLVGVHFLLQTLPSRKIPCKATHY